MHFSLNFAGSDPGFAFGVGRTFWAGGVGE